MIYIIVFIVGIYLLMLLFGCIDVYIDRRKRVKKLRNGKCLKNTNCNSLALD